MADQEYEFKKIEIGADRDFIPGPLGGTNPMDLKAITGEVSIFEDITKGYLTAKIVILDDAAIVAEISEMQGTETLVMEIAGAEGNKSVTFRLHMKIVSIVSQTKVNDKASAYVINAISDHGYRNSLSKLSKSYTGHLEDTAEEILESHLELKVKRDSKYIGSEEKSIQGDVKVLIPYISPLESMQWLLERTTSIEGSPYFGWASMWDQEDVGGQIRLGSFKTMLREGIAASNKNRTFKYSVASTMPNPTAEDQRFSIKSFEQNNRENTLNMTNNGTLGSRIMNLDTYTSQTMDRHFDLGKYIESLKSSVSNAPSLLRTAYDEKHKVKVEGENKIASEHDARYTNMITSYGTYGWQNGYHDVTDPALLMNKIRKSATMSMLSKNILDVTVPGYNLISEKISVGDVLLFIFDSQIVNDVGPEELKKDLRTSGFYLILRSRHIYTSTTHNTILSCAKVADLPDGV